MALQGWAAPFLLGGGGGTPIWSYPGALLQLQKKPTIYCLKASKGMSVLTLGIILELDSASLSHLDFH